MTTQASKRTTLGALSIWFVGATLSTACSTAPHSLGDEGKPVDGNGGASGSASGGANDGGPVGMPTTGGAPAATGGAYDGGPITAASGGASSGTGGSTGTLAGNDGGVCPVVDGNGVVHGSFTPPAGYPCIPGGDVDGSTFACTNAAFFGQYTCVPSSTVNRPEVTYPSITRYVGCGFDVGIAPYDIHVNGLQPSEIYVFDGVTGDLVGGAEVPPPGIYDHPGCPHITSLEWGAQSNCADVVSYVCDLNVGCADHIKNGTETDVDCGGSCPDKCTATYGCASGSDCTSGVCNAGACQ